VTSPDTRDTLTPAAASPEEAVPGQTCPEGWFDGMSTTTMLQHLDYWRDPRNGRRATLLWNDDQKWRWLPDRLAHVRALELEIRLRVEAAS